MVLNLRRPFLHHVSLIAPASIRFASLSAIHRGLRRSERVQYGQTISRPSDDRRSRPSDDRRSRPSDDRRSRPSDDRRSRPSDDRRSRPSDDRRSRPTGERRGRKRKDDDDIQSLTAKALAGAGSKRQQYKLLKKLKKKQQEEDGTGPKTRRKRFMDPDLEFGKKSLVYQLKQGSLQHLTNTIEKPVRPRLSREVGRTTRTPPRDPSSRYTTAEFAERFAAGADEDRARPRPTRPTRTSRATTQHRRDTDLADWKTKDPLVAGAQVSTPAPRERRGKLMPITIQYTTAASQFLYGKSVVKSALEQARRKLYHLYIYGGENRQDSKDNTTILNLASQQGVPVTIVPNEDQRLMDKMSQGRPHNGFVLETSPLPQMPVTALGSLVETSHRMGFNVELDHQTREEEEVNGTDTFIRRSSSVTAKPFVLLLNEILDPGNLGGLLRTASYLGVDAVGITSRNSANLTPVALKSAAGAVEEITVFSVASPAKFLEDSKKEGWKSYAAIPPPDRKLVRRHGEKFVSSEVIEQQSPLSHDPCILVLGNEGYGLSKEIKVAADYELSFPRFVQNSCVDSLNVSVAAGLLCHAFVRSPTAPPQTTKDHSNQNSATNDAKGDAVRQDEAESIF